MVPPCPTATAPGRGVELHHFAQQNLFRVWDHHDLQRGAWPWKLMIWAGQKKRCTHKSPLNNREGDDTNKLSNLEVSYFQTNLCSVNKTQTWHLQNHDFDILAWLWAPKVNHWPSLSRLFVGCRDWNNSWTPTSFANAFPQRWQVREASETHG